MMMRTPFPSAFPTARSRLSWFGDGEMQQCLYSDLAVALAHECLTQLTSLRGAGQVTR